MEPTLVEEFDADMAALAPVMANELVRPLRTHRDTPRATGTLANSIQVVNVNSQVGRISADFQADADHAGILDAGIGVRPIRPVNARALASADGSFGPVASADPARTLNQYRGWWERVFTAVTDSELDRIIEANLGNR